MNGNGVWLPESNGQEPPVASFAARFNIHLPLSYI